MNIGIPVGSTLADLEPHIFSFWPDMELKDRGATASKGVAHANRLKNWEGRTKNYTAQQVIDLLAIHQFIAAP